MQNKPCVYRNCLVILLYNAVSIKLHSYLVLLDRSRTVNYLKLDDVFSSSDIMLIFFIQEKIQEIYITLPFYH